MEKEEPAYQPKVFITNDSIFSFKVHYIDIHRAHVLMVNRGNRLVEIASRLDNLLRLTITYYNSTSLNDTLAQIRHEAQQPINRGKDVEIIVSANMQLEWVIYYKWIPAVLNPKETIELTVKAAMDNTVFVSEGIKQELRQHELEESTRRKVVPLSEQLVADLKKSAYGLFSDIPDQYKEVVDTYLKNKVPAFTLFDLLPDGGIPAKRRIPLIRRLVWQALAEYFGFNTTFVPTQNMVYFENKELLRGNMLVKKVNGAETSWMMQDYEDALYINKDRAQEILGILVSNYKIHLMPKGNRYNVLIKLLQLIKENGEVQKLIATFKFRVGSTLVLGKRDIEQIADRTGARREDLPNELEISIPADTPLVVIYPASGQSNAQRLLEILYEAFNGVPGTGQVPRFNEQITDLLYVAQGNGDDKEQVTLPASNPRARPWWIHYYEQPFMVYYAADITGKQVDYHLKIKNR